VSDAKFRVLFLCVHNSARSQMAEALLRKHASHWFDVESAGFEHRSVMPAAIAAMEQVGIDISGATAKSVFDLFRAGRIYHYVVTVCDEASAEQCPIFPGICERIHWTFPDPSSAETEAERLGLASAVRDQIDAQLRNWLSELEASGGPAPKFHKRFV
jgi:arsenate reductase (thioredoxin)